MRRHPRHPATTEVVVADRRRCRRRPGVPTSRSACGPWTAIKPGLRAHVPRVDPAVEVAADPRPVLVDVGGVDRHHVVVVGEPVEREVVDDPAVLVAQERVLDLADLERRHVVRRERAGAPGAASGPRNSNSPMWLTSKQPTALRTVRCSSTMPAYWTGMSQPPNGIIRAPRRTWAAWSGVRFRGASGWVIGRDPLGLGGCAKRSLLSPRPSRFSTAATLGDVTGRRRRRCSPGRSPRARRSPA